MNRYIRIAIVSLIVVFTGIKGHSQNTGNEKISRALIDSLVVDAVRNERFDEAWDYIKRIEECDSLPFNAIDYSTYCCKEYEDYTEWLQLYNRWVKAFPDENLKSLFCYKLGVVHYNLENYSLAADNLRPYIEWLQDEDIIDTYYRYLYAVSLFESFQFSLAYDAFDDFFNNVVKEEGVPLKILDTCEMNYSFPLYDFAYTCFYLGDEKKGLYYLELSKKCGSELAARDLIVLQNSTTFGKEFDIDKRTQSEFDNLIARYDPKRYLENLDTMDEMEFWTGVREQSPDCKNYLDALQKKRPPGTLTSAMNEIYSQASSMEDYLAQCHPYVKDDTEDQLEWILYGPSRPIKDFRFYPSKDVNAFATPYGQIYITSGLGERYHYMPSLLVGVCAHETTHYMCDHSIVSKWQQDQRERRNDILGGVVAGLYAITMSAAGLYAASEGVAYDDSYWDNIPKMGGYLVRGFDEDSFVFKFHYSRSQEIEADIVAYRFCEEFGLSGYSYIMALQLLGNNDVYLLADATDDHPTTNYRVLLLKYLYNKEHSTTN